MSASTWKNLARRLLQLGSTACRRSYSQRGEDLIAEDLLRGLGIERPVYLDLGTNHPAKFNNTFLFYAKGGSGICVEPNPVLAKLIRSVRPRDLCLNVGIAAAESHPLDFYVFDNDSLSTFSLEQAEKLERETSFKRVRTEQVQMMTVNNVVKNHSEAQKLNFISLDCEGLDISILQTLDFTAMTPELICVETIGCVDSADVVVRRTVKEILQRDHYVPVADTQLNTLFIRENLLGILNISALSY